jgi:hypothetical protein
MKYHSDQDIITSKNFLRNWRSIEKRGRKSLFLIMSNFSDHRPWNRQSTNGQWFHDFFVSLISFDWFWLVSDEWWLSGFAIINNNIITTLLKPIFIIESMQKDRKSLIYWVFYIDKLIKIHKLEAKVILIGLYRA